MSSKIYCKRNMSYYKVVVVRMSCLHKKLVAQFAKIGISFEREMNVNAYIVNPCAMPSIVI